MHAIVGQPPNNENDALASLHEDVAPADVIRLLK